MCPGRRRSSGRLRGSARALIVVARSKVEIPVVVPSGESTETVKAVPSRDVFTSTISGRSSSARRSAVTGTQIRPRPKRVMKLIASGVTACAAITRSPSFSRSSSSTTMTRRPRRISSIASGMVANALIVSPHLHLYLLPSLPPPQRRHGQRGRDQRHGAARILDRGYRQTHSVQRHRALLGDVAGEPRREAPPHPHALAFPSPPPP